MSGDLVPRYAPPANPLPALSSLPRRATLPDDDGGAPQFGRYLAALRRYKWLILVIVVAGSAMGVAATKLVNPEYETSATVLVSLDEQGAGARGTGPIRAGGLMSATAWPELLRSFAILDRVAVGVPLFISPLVSADRHFFEGVTPIGAVKPGRYVLRAGAAGSYELLDANEIVVERGALGDSIGRQIGIGWIPPANLLQGRDRVAFTLRTPRAAAVALRERLGSQMRERSSVMRLTLSGEDPNVIAKSLNVLAREFVTTADELKKRNLVEMTRTLREQVAYAEGELQAAENALESFRVRTITLPAEGGPVAAGIQATQPAVFNSFFTQKIEYDNIRHDRESLERSFEAVRDGRLSLNALLAIPAVNQYGIDLKTALTEYGAAEAKLRSLRQMYTDAHPQVRDAIQTVNTMRTVSIPPLMTALLDQLRSRERDMETRIGNAGNELQQIPARTIEEMRLTRNQRVRENLYQTLKNRYEEAKLAEASAQPDLTVLDTAVAPMIPSSNTAPRLMLMAIVGSLGGALVLAILLDRIDRRFRYPDQATRELGLDVLAAVPRIRKLRRRTANLEQAAQVVEAFRALRLGVSHAAGEGAPLTLTITSPSPNDGKSLVSSNLALSFAQAGYRTLLIDGDIRRGQLHSTFRQERVPGLIDQLRGSATTAETIRATDSPNLWLLTSGTRLRTGQELLVSSALPALLAELRDQFDVILIDSAPLGAGVDAFALGIATRNLALVLRSGRTDRHLAKAKLELMDRLPMVVIGAVLNDVQTKDAAYKYYSYLESYRYTDQVLDDGARSELISAG